MRCDRAKRRRGGDLKLEILRDGAGNLGRAASVCGMAQCELKLREKELDDQLFRVRIQKSMGQLEAAHKLKTLRRDLARVKTVLREKESV